MTQVARSLAAAALVALAGCGGGNEAREAQGTETGAAVDCRRWRLLNR